MNHGKPTKVDNPPIKYRILIIFFGITRSLKWTIESIRGKLLEPSLNAGFKLSVVASFSEPHLINNARSGETNQKPDLEEFRLLEPDLSILTKQNDDLIRRELQSAQSSIDRFDDGWSSVRNSMHSLASIQRGWQAAKTVWGDGFDYCLFARPDLKYLDELDLLTLIQRMQSVGSIALPRWHSWGGFNDRIAFCDPISADVYANRFGLISEYCRTNSYHPETFLRHVLQAQGVRVCDLPLRAQRVRAQGRLHDEDFSLQISDLPDEPKNFDIRSGKLFFLSLKTDFPS